MKPFLVALFSTYSLILILDIPWLSIMNKVFYSKNLSHLLSSSPKLLPAAGFYIIYGLALTILIILPALTGSYSSSKVFLLAALFGLAAYATYDLTNQATLKNWPLLVTLVDLTWGTLLTAFVGLISFLITKKALT